MDMTTMQKYLDVPIGDFLKVCGEWFVSIGDPENVLRYGQVGFDEYKEGGFFVRLEGRYLEIYRTHEKGGHMKPGTYDVKGELISPDGTVDKQISGRISFNPPSFSRGANTCSFLGDDV